MRALFWRNLRKNLFATCISLLAFPIVTALFKSLFRVSNEDMPWWGFLTYVICIGLMAGLAKDTTFKFTDQWLLMLPEPRSRVLYYSWWQMFLAYVNFLLHALIALVIFIVLYVPIENPSLDKISRESVNKLLTPVYHFLGNLALVQYPVVISCLGVAALFFFSMSVFGASKFYEMQLQISKPFFNGKTQSVKVRAFDFLYLLALGAFGAALYEAPHVTPWALLALMAMTYPKMLGKTFALSKRQETYFSFPLLILPAATFCIYFFSGLVFQNYSKVESRREIASVYTKSLIGQRIMPERRKLQLADGNLTVSQITSIREEYQEAYDTWQFKNDFPVTFVDAVKNKKTFALVEAASQGFDSLDRTDADAEAYVTTLVAIEKKSNLQPLLPGWARFHPSEELSLKMLNSSDSTTRSFGIYVSLNAPSSQKIQLSLAKLVKSPDVSDFDLVNISQALSVQLQRSVSIAWIQHAQEMAFTSGTAVQVDCESYRKLDWEQATKKSDYLAFTNVCIRDFESRQAPDPTSRYHLPSFPRSWAEKLERYKFAMWKKRDQMK
jgi:hypothetical protein